MRPLDHLRSALADRYTVERELGQGGMATGAPGPIAATPAGNP